jgi:HK97 family phage portal protein
MIDLHGVSFVTPHIAGEGYPASTDDFWYTSAPSRTASGMRVSDDSALNYSAVWAATRLLSSSIGWLPLDLFRRLPKGGRELAEADSRETLVHDRPNGEMGSMLWRCSMAAQQVNAGNAYSMIERRVIDQKAVALWPVHYTRVTPRRASDGGLIYEVRNDNDKPDYIDAADMLHCPSMMSDDGIMGKGVIRNARESIGFGLATERYGANWFQGQGIPRVIVSHPSKLSPEARMNFRKEWREIHGGATGDRVALLAEGATISPLNLSQEDSQFLQTRQHNIEEIARWYGVPPHKLQHLLRATFSNIEEQNIDFVIDSLLPWLKIWEQELWRKLLTPEEQASMFFEFNVMALLRGNSTGRAAYFQSMLTNGVMNRNEVRAIENYNPVEGGDVFLVQGAMAPVDLLVEKMEAEIEALDAEPESVEIPADSMDDAEDAPAVAVRDAALILVECTVERLTRKEAADATRAASKPAEFLAWMDAFYGRHEAYLVEDLEHPCKALRACGMQILAEAIASDICRESRERLLEVSGECTATTLAKAVEAEVSTWSTRKPKALIERLRA